MSDDARRVEQIKAQVAAGVAQAYDAIAVTQQEGARVLVENGVDVVAGHSDVGRPGRAGDPMFNQTRPMADTGAPEPARDLLSAEAHRYVDQVPVMQAQAARNPYLNGEDSRGRVDPVGRASAAARRPTAAGDPMTTFTPSSFAISVKATLTGNVPPQTNDTQSDAAKGSVDAVAALHAAAQAKIKAAGSLSMISRCRVPPPQLG